MKAALKYIDFWQSYREKIWLLYYGWRCTLVRLLLSAVYDSCQSPDTAFPHSIFSNAQQLTVVAHVNNPACQCMRYIVVPTLLLVLHLQPTCEMFISIYFSNKIPPLRTTPTLRWCVAVRYGGMLQYVTLMRYGVWRRRVTAVRYGALRRYVTVRYGSALHRCVTVVMTHANNLYTTTSTFPESALCCLWLTTADALCPTIAAASAHIDSRRHSEAAPQSSYRFQLWCVQSSISAYVIIFVSPPAVAWTWVNNLTQHFHILFLVTPSS